MAARQALFKRAPRRPELEKLLEAARASKISDEELAEQRISFAFGNAPENSKITKDSARLAAKRIRILAD
ncbi:MAG: hypothetical protein ACLPN5_10215 [Roseiarcus sp.]